MDVISSQYTGPQFAMHDHQDENCHNPVREEGYLFWKTSAQGRMLFSAQCKTGEKNSV